MAGSISITIRNPHLLAAIMRPEIYRPAAQRAIEKIGVRMERGGKGLGARNNTVVSKPGTLSATVTSTLHNPRQKGTSWQRKNIVIANAMASRQLNAEFKREVEAEFARAAG